MRLKGYSLDANRLNAAETVLGLWKFREEFMFCCPLPTFSPGYVLSLCVCVRVIDSIWCCGAECVVLLSMRGHPSFSVIHEQPVLEVLSAGYNRAYLYFGLVDHTTSSITVSALIEFVYLVDISVLGKYDFH